LSAAAKGPNLLVCSNCIQGGREGLVKDLEFPCANKNGDPQAAVRSINMKKNSPWHKVLFTSDNFTLTGILGSSYKGNYVRETTYVYLLNSGGVKVL